MNKLVQFLSVLVSSFLLLSTNLCGDQSSEEVFKNIYDNQVWGRDGQGYGTSGGGSSLETTVKYRHYLQDFLTSHNITSVVDVGCGDWGFSHAIDWDGIQYTGFDVVEFVINRNQEKYSAKNIHFIYGNGITMELPEADLLICKDVLQHLTNEDITLFISKINKFKYCLITNDVDPGSLSSNNEPISRGSYRSVDLTKPPFSLKGTKVLNFESGPCVKQVLLIERQQ